MYAQVEKSKDRNSQAAANSIVKNKINGNKGFSLEDNRSNKKINYSVIQKVKVPEGLTEGVNTMNSVSKDMKDFKVNGDENYTLYGSEMWGTQTSEAAIRKANEWYAVKHILNNYPIGQVGSEEFKAGFGVSDETEADARYGVYDSKSGELTTTAVAIENKYVTGSHAQVGENIRRATSQLLAEGRAPHYSNTVLTARIEISPKSGAWEDLQKLDTDGLNAQMSRWFEVPTTFVDSKYTNLPTGTHTMTLIIQVPEYGALEQTLTLTTTGKTNKRKTKAAIKHAHAKLKKVNAKHKKAHKS